MADHERIRRRQLARSPGSILRVDPATGATLATIPGQSGAFGIAFGFGAVWVANQDDYTVQRIDPATNQIVATIDVIAPSGIAVDANGVWVVDLIGEVSKINPVTNQVVSTIHTQATGSRIATGGDGLGVNPGTLGAGDGSVTRINSATGLLTSSIPVGDYPNDIAYAGGSVWVGLYRSPTLVRINPGTNTILGKLTVVGGVYAVTGTDHAVWTVHNLPTPAGGLEPSNGSVTRVGY